MTIKTDENSKTDYKKQIEELLGHFDDGWDVFKKPKHWDYPLVRKEASKDMPGLPSTWIELVEKTVGIIAEGKYDMDVYDNTIALITADQMLDACSSHGLPVFYDHWSFGMQRVMEEKKFRAGMSGMAYEIVINTDPSIAYCMEGNSPLMQILVIAHACFGHNNFFKQNYMFKDFTNAKDIILDLTILRDFIRECEAKYGFDRVEKVIDACHALKFHDIRLYNRPDSERNVQKDRELAEKMREARFRMSPEELRDMERRMALKADFDDGAKPQRQERGFVPGNNEENILKYVANNAQHLEEWQRRIMTMISDVSQYFFPQMHTKVMNEGWATFWHYQLLHDMSDLGLLDDSQMFELYDSHGAVTKQHDFDASVPVVDQNGNPVIDPETGQPKRHNIYSGINPYALGWAMMEDIKRICIDPTEEDKKWFPDLAGSQDWVSALNHAMENFNDETFILQYLSPKVIRDFKFFEYADDQNKDYVEVTAIHDSEGYQKIRNGLADQYRIMDMFPKLEVEGYYNLTDRRMVIKHKMQDDKPLDENGTMEVMKHLYQLWKHPVILQTVDEDGDIISEISCPPDHRPQKLAPGLS